MDCEHLGVSWVLFDLRADAAGDAPAPLLPGPGRLAVVSARVGCAGPGSGALRGRLTGQAALPLLGVQRRARPGQLCTRPRQRRPPGRSVGTARRPSGDTQLIGRAAHPPGQNCLRAAARHATAREPRGRSRSRQVAYGSPRARRPGQTRAGSGLAGAGQRPPCARGPPGRRRSAAAGRPHGAHVLTVGRRHSELRGARSLGQRPRAEPSFGPRWVSTGTPGARLCGLEQDLWGQEPVCHGAWQRQGALGGAAGSWGRAGSGLSVRSPPWPHASGLHTAHPVPAHTAREVPVGSRAGRGASAGQGPSAFSASFHGTASAATGAQAGPSASTPGQGWWRQPYRTTGTAWPPAARTARAPPPGPGPARP